MHKWILLAGAVLGATAVLSGAFGAHALKNVLDAKAAGWYDTAVSYHAGHALAVLIVGNLSLYAGSGSAAVRTWLRASAYLFIFGILLFSGSLYTMAFTGMTSLGMITPIGGVFLVLAWICLGISAIRLPSGVS